MIEAKRLRVLFSRPALDGHDRGVITVMNACRDAGFEIVYTYFYDPKAVVKPAVEEDVDTIAITCSMGQHLRIASALMKALEEEKVNIPLIMGGVIPTTDVPELLNMGVKAVFGPGSTPKQAVSFISQLAGA